MNESMENNKFDCSLNQLFDCSLNQLFIPENYDNKNKCKIFLPVIIWLVSNGLLKLEFFHDRDRLL